MGTHGAAGTRRSLARARRAAGSDNAPPSPVRRLDLGLTDWPVARRLFAVIVAALLMGLVFGGLRVADAENSASQFSKTEQLAKLGARLTGVVNDLQSERDATLVTFLGGQASPALGTLQAATRSDLVPVREELAAILQGGFPATVAASARTVNSAVTAASVNDLQQLTSTASDPSAVFADYSAVIGYVLALQQQVALGVTDASLTSNVQTLNSLALAKDEVSQEEALLDEVLTNEAVAYNLTPGVLDFNTETSLRVAYEDELTDVAAFQGTATQAESALFDAELGPQAQREASETMTDNLEAGIFADASGNPPTAANGITPLVVVGTSGIPLHQVIANQVGVPGISTQGELMAAWDAGMGAKLSALQDTENLVAGNIVSRATQLQQSAQQSALTYLVITVAVLLIVMLAALLVARSLVLPLRRLRAGALDIASVQLPERVRLLSENPESAGSMEIAPINVSSQDEIGQVARAFDQVHSEAMRLAGEQALLRSSFNAMFVNLSRRSQTLIERLARMIDNLEQHEDDPDRLGSLFSMDHLVTRMRRNSENLLLLAGHDNPRKWSEGIALADVARAATSEIEQYNRVTLNIPPDISLAGQAVSDVVHLLAELVENATIFSPKDTQVQVVMQHLASGGVLIEISDKGIGVSDTRLEEMNWRLDNPPAIDVSVSRHMGLFAVARLAERHRVRVRLRPALPQGLSALVWLPDSLIERTNRFAAINSWSAHQAGARTATAEAVDLASGGNGNGNGNGYGTAGARLPSGWFRRGQAGTLLATSAGAGAGADDPPGLGENGAAAGLFAERVNGDQNAGGLPVRVPRGDRAQGGWPPDGQGGIPQVRTPGGPPAGHGANPLPRRSPDQARSRLSGFQRGTRRAEGQEGTGGKAPQAGEGTER
jgi:signal transduction histidine kinase